MPTLAREAMRRASRGRVNLSRLVVALPVRRERIRGLAGSLHTTYFMTNDEVRAGIIEACDELRDMLLAKNEAYGNSALDPIRCFSKASTVEQLNVRLDDKLSRLMRGSAAGEDVELDLQGYLILKRVARKLAPSAP